MEKIELKEKELEEVKKSIKELQKKRKALDSYIRLFYWYKKKKI